MVRNEEIITSRMRALALLKLAKAQNKPERFISKSDLHEENKKLGEKLAKELKSENYRNSDERIYTGKKVDVVKRYLKRDKKVIERSIDAFRPEKPKAMKIHKPSHVIEDKGYSKTNIKHKRDSPEYQREYLKLHGEYLKKYKVLKMQIKRAEKKGDEEKARTLKNKLVALKIKHDKA